MKIRNYFYAIMAITIVGFAAGPAMAQETAGTLPNNLFTQYYTQPGASAVTAEMYPAPHPVPRNVGHTYYTYQPLMPHEMMYSHSRNYYNFYAGPESFYHGGCYPCGSGLNKTTVKWHSGVFHMAPMSGTSVLLGKLQAKIAGHKYRGREYWNHQKCGWGGNCGGCNRCGNGCQSGNCGGGCSGCEAGQPVANPAPSRPQPETDATSARWYPTRTR